MAVQDCILVVDDESSVRTFLKTVLKKADFKVLEACDGLEALSVIEQSSGRIDLLLTDIRMPRLDGVALAETVAQRYPDIPVLFLSGYPFEVETERQKHPSRACGFVQKPFLPKALLEAVRKCLDSPEPAIRATA